MKNWYFILFLIFAKCAFSQDVTFTASAPEVVELGQQFRLIYSINAKANNFSAQTVNGISVLAGPSTSQSSNVSIINGKVTQNFELRYTYILQAKKEGVFTIPPAEVMVDKKSYKSNTIKIEVIKGSPRQERAITSPSGTNQSQQTTNQNQISNSDLYIKIFVSKSKVHREEHLIATIKLFSRLNITRLENAKLPSFQGFITEELEVPPLTSLNRERINDQVYLTGVLKKYILYPQKSGKIKIDPFELDVHYQKPGNRRSRSMFDDFFGAIDSEGRKVVSNSVTINVSDLPKNKPFSFSGAVGQIKLSASVDNSDVNTNDAVSLKVKISGSGNLKYINPLKIEFPSDFDVYDPKVSDNIKYSERGAIGNKTFEYLMIPRHAGEFTIPAFSFSYFDTKTDQYKTQKAGPFNIKVGKSVGDTMLTVSTAFTKEDVKFLGQDIRFIKKDIKLKKINQFIFGSSTFYLAYVFGIILFFIIFLFRRKKMKESANIILVKNKKAKKFARKRLKKASGFMKLNQRETFYEELVKALWGYISDKLGIPVANLSKDNVRSEMLNRKVDEQYIEQILSIIDRCEYARYAPVTEETKMDTLYKDAIKVISKLQQKLK
ncbi:MAG: BatD family protein [Bacteroidales bacterium]|nr:BatD family protein [Bacteroidales bacterium]